MEHIGSEKDAATNKVNEDYSETFLHQKFSHLQVLVYSPYTSPQQHQLPISPDQSQMFCISVAQTQ